MLSRLVLSKTNTINTYTKIAKIIKIDITNPNIIITNIIYINTNSTDILVITFLINIVPVQLFTYINKNMYTICSWISLTSISLNK